MRPKKREEKPQLELYRTELKWMIDDIKKQSFSGMTI